MKIIKAPAKYFYNLSLVWQGNSFSHFQAVPGPGSGADSQIFVDFVNKTKFPKRPAKISFTMTEIWQQWN